MRFELIIMSYDSRSIVPLTMRDVEKRLNELPDEYRVVHIEVERFAGDGHQQIREISILVEDTDFTGRRQPA